MNTQKTVQQLARKRRTHAKVRAITGVPRLVVYRSNKAIYAQVVDDEKGVVLCSSSGLKAKKGGVEGANEIGKKIAELAKAKKVSKVAFDRNGYKYHGQVKSLAEGAREGGLTF